MRRDHRTFALAWLIVFGLHGCMVILAAARHGFIPDENAYLNLAQNLAGSGRFALDFGTFWHRPGQPFTYFAPGWPALLAVGYGLAGMAGCWVVLWAVWCGDAALIYALGRVCRLPAGASWVLVLWLTLNPLYAYYHGHLMTEPVVLGFVLATAALGIAFVRSPTSGGAVALGIVSAAAHLTRTQALLPLLAVGLVALALVPWRRLVPLGALLVAVHLALVGPWLARMAAVGATPYGTELKLGINLFTYCGGFGVDSYSFEVAPLPYPPGLMEMTPAERNRVLTRAALDAIARDPGAYLRTCGERLGYLVAPVASFRLGTESEARWRGILLGIGLLGATVLFYYLPLAASALALLRRRAPGRAGWVLLTTVGLWYLFHILVHASIRQRLPSDALVATLALTLWWPRGDFGPLPRDGGSAGLPGVGLDQSK